MILGLRQYKEMIIATNFASFPERRDLVVQLQKYLSIYETSLVADDPECPYNRTLGDTVANLIKYKFMNF